MKTAIISNHNDKRIKVDLIGTSKTNRSLAFNGNIDITVSKSNYEYIVFELDDKAKLNVKNSRSALLEDEKSLTNQHNEKTVSISVALAVSSLLFVIGLMIVFTVDHVFLNKKRFLIYIKNGNLFYIKCEQTNKNIKIKLCI